MNTKGEKEVCEILDKLNITYRKYNHKAVYTIEEAKDLSIDIPGRHCKNIFICDRKKKSFFLVILPEDKKLDFKIIENQLSYKGLRFASEEMLHKYLGVEAGSVTPFGLINDISKEVEVIIDKDIEAGDYVSFHPNVNTATITITLGDFNKFLQWCENKLRYIDMRIL
jgi:Ala-tRNA(Pro) deacylase